ncbi:hypothetical protein TNCV_1181161 [Trichonephila clavipes]|nr:hypothetical protein TNCV_1181161 [Trichonephila clavipes]
MSQSPNLHEMILSDTKSKVERCPGISGVYTRDIQTVAHRTFLSGQCLQAAAASSLVLPCEENRDSLPALQYPRNRPLKQRWLNVPPSRWMASGTSIPLKEAM